MLTLITKRLSRNVTKRKNVVSPVLQLKREVETMPRMNDNSTLRRPVIKDPPSGCLFTPLFLNGKLAENHPLDTNLNEYYKLFYDEVIPVCGNIAPNIDGYKERITEVISYNTPAFKDCWNFGVELSYRLLAPGEMQTEENIKLIRILRVCMDLTFAMSAVLDDIADNSPRRKNKPAWHTFCKGGVPTAIYDGIVLGNLPFYLIKKYFKDRPGYAKLLETFAESNNNMIIGEIVDVLSHNDRGFSLNEANNIISFKAGHFVECQVALGMIHAGILDEHLIEQAEKIFFEFGKLIQTWDDFNDYYSETDLTGKPSCDFQNAGTTWVSSTAMLHFNDHQKRQFNECYGSSDPIKIEMAKRLYDEIDIPNKYIEYMSQVYTKSTALIKQLPHTNLQNVCFSYLNWLIGGVAERANNND